MKVVTPKKSTKDYSSIAYYGQHNLMQKERVRLILVIGLVDSNYTFPSSFYTDNTLDTDEIEEKS